MSRPGSLPEKIKEYPESWFVPCRREKCALWIGRKQREDTTAKDLIEGHCSFAEQKIVCKEQKSD
jgi:hypothetical protein